MSMMGSIGFCISSDYLSLLMLCIGVSIGAFLGFLFVWASRKLVSTIPASLAITFNSSAGSQDGGTYFAVSDYFCLITL